MEEEESNWRNATVILAVASAIILTTQLTYGFFLLWHFQLFTIYIPTLLSLTIYLKLKLKKRRIKQIQTGQIT